MGQLKKLNHQPYVRTGGGSTNPKARTATLYHTLVWRLLYLSEFLPTIEAIQQTGQLTFPELVVGVIDLFHTFFPPGPILCYNEWIVPEISASSLVEWMELGHTMPAAYTSIITFVIQACPNCLTD
jgi:hypothetical protein